MKSKVLITLFVALGAICSFARVVEDSKSRFVLDDDVIESSVHSCLDASDRGGVFLPENAAYLDGSVSFTDTFYYNGSSGKANLWDISTASNLRTREKF